MKYSVLILTLLLLFSCKKEKTKTDYLGVVNITISGKEKAIPHFEKGLLLLHSFEYEDAREEFIKAQEEDSLMPMSYWGEAMTYNHSLWAEQNYDKGMAALKHIEDIELDKQATELEKDFIKAAQILYQPKIEKPERDMAYADFMEELSEKYPSNHEIAAFYALSLLGSVPEGRDDAIYGKGARIAKGVLEENPNHPGALHYLIHSYDDPNHAPLALEAANSYSKVAPDASHALHMPSHIYVAMGIWDEVISSNIDSYQASLNRMERKNLGNDARGYHAFHWLEYGYLQKGNSEEARNMVMNMSQYSKESPSKRARVHMVFLKGTYLVGTNDWTGDISDIEVDVADLNVSVRSQYNFLDGMKYYKNGNKKGLDSIISKIGDDSNRATFIVSNSNAKLCAGVSRDEANETDITEAKIRQRQLMALASNLNNDIVLAEKYFLESIALEESISYSYGPPAIQKPTHELYADWLLTQNRKKEAIEHYKIGLKAAPKRLLALEGIDQANKI
jgi:tetratricopeptide (TPR) repeat protein